MELKSKPQSLIELEKTRSNRTFMELKFGNVWSFVASTMSSNRTFMELKYRQSGYFRLPTLSSNRTFMELK